MHECNLEKEGMLELAQGDFPALRYLNVVSCEFESKSLTKLLASPAVQQLNWLVAGGSELSNLDPHAIQVADGLPNLQAFGVESSGFSTKTLKAFRDEASIAWRWIVDWNGLEKPGAYEKFRNPDDLPNLKPEPGMNLSIFAE
ncbi:MAG: hypothetical protein AAF585_25405 [Verrucomicrobiota bacterium]